MNAGRLAPWRRLGWVLCTLTSVCALWDAAAGLTLFLLVLTAAAATGYLVVRRDPSPTDALAVDRLPGDRDSDRDAEDPGRRLGWIVPTAPLPPPPAPAELATWSDQSLCQAWRVSYLRLRRLQHLPQPGAVVARMASERATYLNEIERRYPDGFSAWMAAGARAPSDPTRFLVRAARSREGDDR